MVIVEYIRLSYLLTGNRRRLPARTRFMIDTHDVMHHRCELFRRCGKEHWLHISRDEERQELERFDYVIAIQEIDAERLQRIFAVNVFGTMLCAREAVRRMSTRHGGRGGAIVNLSSSAALVAEPGFGAFAAARAALGRMTEGRARELGPDGIRVNAVCPMGVEPGPSGNPGLVAGATRGGRSLEDWAAARIPLGRLQGPEETANVILFLASDLAGFVSGQSILVAGGAPA